MDLLERLQHIVRRYEELVAAYDRQLAELAVDAGGDHKLADAMRSARRAAETALSLARDSVVREERIRLRQLANRSRAPFSLRVTT